MTLQEYVSLVNGKQIEAGGSTDAKFQCVDLINDYFEKVLGVPKILGTDAKDFITKGVASGKFEKVAEPQAGDIAVWDWGQYGHIAIYLGNSNYLTQNYPLTQRTTIATIGRASGYMRRKGGLMSAEYDEIKGILKAMTDDYRSSIDALSADMRGRIDGVNAKVVTLKMAVEELSGKTIELPEEDKQNLVILKRIVDFITNIFKRS